MLVGALEDKQPSYEPNYRSVPTDFEENNDGWKVTRLKEVCTAFVSGGTPSTSNPDFWNGEIPWLRSAWIKGRYVLTGEKFITELGLDNSATNIVPKDNLLVATRVSIGNVAINKIDIAINQDLTGIVLDKSKANTEFLYWMLLKSTDVIKTYVQGSTIQGLTREDLGNLRFPFPPFLEQQKIASILSKVDELVQKIDQVIEQTQRLKKGLMQRLLTKGIGHNKFKKTRIGEIPEEWQLELSHELFSFVTSGSRDWAKYYSEKGAVMIRIENLDHETIYPDLTTAQRVALPSGIEGVRTRVKPNDILVSITADVGMVGVISESVPEAYVNQHIALIRPNEGINSKYIARYLSWNEGGVKQFRELQGGVTKVGLTLQDMKKIWIPWPSDAEQHEIVSILDSVELIISKCSQHRYKLQDLKKGLMQKLLTGKIRVKV